MVTRSTPVRGAADRVTIRGGVPADGSRRRWRTPVPAHATGAYYETSVFGALVARTSNPAEKCARVAMGRRLKTAGMNPTRVLGSLQNRAHCDSFIAPTILR